MQGSKDWWIFKNVFK